MGKMIKLAWWAIHKGKLDREMQEKFEKAQRLSDLRGLPVTIKCEITVKPPRKDEPEYQPVSYLATIKEPVLKPKEFDLVRREGFAVADAENQPDQTHLELHPEDGAPAPTTTPQPQLQS